MELNYYVNILSKMMQQQLFERQTRWNFIYNSERTSVHHIIIKNNL